MKKHYKESELICPEDTTDVSVFRGRLRQLFIDAATPMWYICAIAFLHALFNQETVLEAFLNEDVINIAKKTIDFGNLLRVLRRFHAKNLITRSSNYYSVTLRKYLSVTLHKWNDNGTWKDPPASAAERDALMAKLIFQCVPIPLWDLYEAAPSRDYWKAANLMWQHNIHHVSKGIANDYMHKCALDRVFSVVDIDPGTVSWWPCDCPAYKHGIAKVFGDLPHEDFYGALMYIYKEAGL